MEPVWLVSDGRVLASAHLTTNRAERRRGLLGQSNVDAPLVLEPCAWVHSVGMRVAIDIAYVGDDNVVIATSHLKPWRVGPPVRGAKRVIEAASGSIERWNVKVGDTIEVRHVRT